MQKVVVDPKKYERVKFTKSIVFTAGDVTVEFYPVQLVGYSYKVLVKRSGALIGSDWMSDHCRLSEKMAEFFYNKIVHHVYKS